MSDKVREISLHNRYSHRAGGGVGLSPREDHDSQYGAGNGGSEDIPNRVKALEDKVSTTAIDIAVLKETVATKETLHKELNFQTWKIIEALVIAVSMAVLIK